MAGSLVALIGCRQIGERRAPPPAAAATVDARTENGVTRFDVTGADGAHHTFVVSRDSTVDPAAPVADARLVAEPRADIIVLTDSYPSLPGGLSMCQAGEERFLRVIALDSEPPRELLRLKTGSCRGDIELAGEGVTWRPDSSLLRVRLLGGDSVRGATAVRTYRLEPGGRARLARIE